MTATFPCPHCGVQHGTAEIRCRECDYDFCATSAKSGSKCSRCGADFDAGFTFCQVCGLRLTSRYVRPATQGMIVRGEASHPAHEDANDIHPPPHRAVSPTLASAQYPSSATETDRLVTSASVSDDGDLPPSPPSWTAMEELGQPVKPEGARLLRIACVARDGSDGESFVVGQSPLEIGREAEISFPHDSFISPRHCRVAVTPGGRIHLTDLGSHNGVYVRILATQRLFPGDRFLLGHQLLALEKLPSEVVDPAMDGAGVRGFGTPLQPAWGVLVLLGVGDVFADRYFLRGNHVVFGREAGDILFPGDGFLSRQHARLRMELRGSGVEVLLEDLQSANGTYLRMRREAALEVGDMFRVGDQLFRVRTA